MGAGGRRPAAAAVSPSAPSGLDTCTDTGRSGRTLGLREARGQVVDTRGPWRERGMGRAGSGALE